MSDTDKGEESPKLVASTMKLEARARSKKDTNLASEGAEAHQEQAKTNVLIDKNRATAALFHLECNYENPDIEEICGVIEVMDILGWN